MLNNEDYALIKYAKSHGVKVVISTIVPLINGWKIDMYRRCGNLPVPTTYKMLMQSLQLADLLIVETQAEKDFIVKHYKIQKSKICIIPNGIDKYEGVYRDIYNYIDEGKKYILQVGRFDKNKNQLNVIKAMKNENIDLVFIGGPQNENDGYYIKCKEEAKGYENIHFLGWIESNSTIIKSAYQNADLVIIPSYFETFGMVILEAISARKKIVVSNTLPILEYNIIKYGSFSPNNIQDIRNKTLEVLKMQETNVNLKNIEKNFKWDNVVDKHIKYYKELLNEKNFNSDI